MAIETGITHGAATAWRLSAMIAGLPRFVRVALQSHRAIDELNDLSDHYLRDIGVDRPDIAEMVKRETAAGSLLGTGWRRRP